MAKTHGNNMHAEDVLAGTILWHPTLRAFEVPTTEKIERRGSVSLEGVPIVDQELGP